jgi:predicted amidohydrolase YtcJ
MPHADVLFTGGTLFGGPDGEDATALAVKDGRILAVGDDDSLRGLRGPATEVVALHGRLLSPGFQDAHIHAVMGGLELNLCNLAGTTDLDEYLRRIRQYATENPEAEWIVGGGWSMESFEGGVPHKDILDRIISDRPVFLMNRDHHAAWVNSEALRRAGITATTPDPTSGRIDRDHDGNPVGALQEGAMDLVPVPATTERERRNGLYRAQELLHQLGITAWQDAMMCATNGYPDIADAYLTAARDRTLTATVIGALWWDRDKGAGQIAELEAKRELYTVGRLRSSTVKLMLDGIAENFTAAMTEPYRDACGCTTTNKGLEFIDPEALKTYVTELHARGFQTHFHALGDRAVRDALNAIETARNSARTMKGINDTRPHLAHLQVIHPDDIPRFHQLEATANMQPYWAAHEPQMDDLTLPFLDPALATRQYPFGDLERAHARLAGGSDWPVSTPDPMQGIHVAVNRIHHEDNAESFLPAQRLSLGTALTAYTKGSAFVNHLDDTGALREGFRADLVVLDRNPFDHEPQRIGDTRVAMTFVDGARVYAAPNA